MDGRNRILAADTLDTRLRRAILLIKFDAFTGQKLVARHRSIEISANELALGRRIERIVSSNGECRSRPSCVISLPTIVSKLCEYGTIDSATPHLSSPHEAIGERPPFSASGKRCEFRAIFFASKSGYSSVKTTVFAPSEAATSPQSPQPAPNSITSRPITTSWTCASRNSHRTRAPGHTSPPSPSTLVVSCTTRTQTSRRGSPRWNDASCSCCRLYWLIFVHIFLCHNVEVMTLDEWVEGPQKTPFSGFMEAVNASRPDVLGKLPQLQNMVKRDPVGYRTEFLMQRRHFESEYQLFLLQPSKESAHFGALVSFLSHVAKCYPVEMMTFPEKIMDLLRDNYLVLVPELRKTLVQSLMLLRNRGLVDAIKLLKLFFELFRCPDKRLRESLYQHIVSSIYQLNARSRNLKVNKALQNFLFEMLQDESEHAAIKSLQVLVELFKRKIWHDQRSVNVIATACTSKNTKLMVMALSFFLGIDGDILEDEEQQKKEKKALVNVNYHAHSKKTKKRQRDTLQALYKNKRARNRELDFKATFPAIELLNDPQGIAERQLKLLKSCTERFEVKLLMMNFIGRLIGFHKLVVLPFYPLLQRYLQSHQQNVTAILAYLVQSCHDEIPPEELLPVVKSIAHNFITERCSSEVIAVGMNALREVFRRTPLLLECEGMDVLISDLIQYNRARDKTVVMAARGVLNLIRSIHPILLKRKVRGKFYNDAVKPNRFGELVASEGVDGADLLAEAEAAGRFDDEDNKDGWEIASSTTSEDGEWVDISSDEEGSTCRSVEETDMKDGETSDEVPVIQQKDRLDARRVLTSLDFKRIEILKKERDAALKDPKSRSKRKAEEIAEKANGDATKVNPTDLEGYSKKKRMTQEERLRHVLEGREDYQHKRSGGGTTNTEKKRLKHFMMIKKSKHVQSKVLVSARQVQSQKNRVVKKILKHDAKKRRKI